MSKPFEFNWIVDTDVQDIAENAVDMGHFTSVHRYLRMPVIREIWIKDHQLEITFDTQRRVFGWLTNVNISIHYYGLGVVVSHVKSGPAEVTVLYMPTPISDNKVHICMCVAFRKSTIPFANWFMRMLLPIEIATDFASDIPVWENKAYHLKPVLCAGDGPIMKMRKWAKQFYLPVTT